MDIKLIDKSGQKITVPYYEISLKAKALVENYISLNENNKLQFDSFSKKCIYFDPYLDFLIIHMGYSIENPFLYEKGLLTYDNNKYNYSYDNTSKNYPNILDMELKKFDELDIKDMIITPNLKCIIIDRENNMSHEKYLKMLFLELATSNKKLYDSFIESNLDYYYYFVNYLGYSYISSYDDFINIFYNEKIDNKELKQHLEKIKELYSNVNFIPMNNGNNLNNTDDIIKTI